MTRHLILCIWLALVWMAIVPSRVLAQEHDRGRLRAGAGVDCRCVLSDNTTFTDPVFGTVQTRQTGAGFAMAFDAEFLPIRFFGVGVALGYSSVPTEFSHTVGTGVQQDNLGIMPIFFSANAHIINNKSLDVYAGYTAAYMIYLNDPVYEVPGLGSYVVTTNNEFTGTGFNFGVDVSVNELWAISGSFRMVNADADSTHNLPVDPTYITFGVTRKF